MVRKGRLVVAKAKWNNFTKTMMMGSGGFPDFVCFKFYKGYNGIKTWEMIAVECKTNGTLDKLEKQKMKWLIDNHIFSKILIASKHKIKNRIHINYEEWKIK